MIVSTAWCSSVWGAVSNLTIVGDVAILSPISGVCGINTAPSGDTIIQAPCGMSYIPGTLAYQGRGYTNPSPENVVFMPSLPKSGDIIATSPPSIFDSFLC